MGPAPAARAGKAEAVWNGTRVMSASPSLIRSLAGAAVIAAACCVMLPDVRLKALCAALAFLMPLAEASNECIEIIVDRISEEWHPLSRDAKDLGSCMQPLAMLPLAAALACCLPLAVERASLAPSWAAYLRGTWAA